MDLRKGPPRPPAEKLAGLVFLARTTDKARAIAAGTQGEYKMEGVSTRLFAALGITEAAFIEAVRGCKNDDEVAAWVRAHSDPAKYDEINTALLERNIPPERRPDLATRYPFLNEKPELVNVFEMIAYDDDLMFGTRR